MLRILLIDDQPDHVQPLVEELKSRLGAESMTVASFEEAEKAISDYRPDILVLDVIRLGPKAEPQPEGANLFFAFVWAKHFCPVIIYSAYPESIEDQLEEHPFVRVVKKGSGSELKVVRYAEEFRGHIESFDEVERDIRKAINDALRHIAPHAFAVSDEADARTDFLVRAARRRVAALMDECHWHGTRLACWEHYLHPPCHRDLLVGDILRERGGSSEDPRSFRVILTPSCDMERRGDCQPRVKEVLVAKCKGPERLLKALKLDSSTRKDKLRKRLPPALRHGYVAAAIPLPAFPGVIPTMTADLRDLELIHTDQIQHDGTGGFVRIASMDSPFREMVAWAYVQISRRPGLPERDFEAWRDEIIAAIAPDNSASQGNESD